MEQWNENHENGNIKQLEAMIDLDYYSTIDQLMEVGPEKLKELWGSYSFMLYLNRNRRIKQEGVEFKQIDAEWHWDDFLMLQAIAASLLCLCFPLSNLPIFDSRGFVCCFILHIGISEPLYYWLHRFLHSPALFQNYHWLHHSSKVLHPFTAGHATFLEHLLLCVVVVVGTPISALGRGLIG